MSRGATDCREHTHADLLTAALSRLFGQLEAHALADLVSRIELQELARGERLYLQGEPGTNMHILLTGRLQVRVKTEDGTERVVAHLQPGEAVGEMALLTGARRAATIVATRDCTLGALTRQDFDNIVSRHPDVFSHIARFVIGRLTNTQARAAVRSLARTIAIVPLHATIDRDAFCRRLQLALLRFGSNIRLDSTIMRHRFPAGFAGGEADRFLDECEHTHDFVLLEASDRPTDWTRKCLGFADRILLVASGTAPPQLTALERDLLAHVDREGYVLPELAILHPAGVQPAGTRDWLSGRSLARHYHVPMGGSEGFNRLARFLADRAVALVLAGGGARGFSHLGVIRALREHGIPIDAVGGTSFGAIAATGPARCIEIEHMIEELSHAFINERPLDDYTVPVVSVIRGDRLDRLLAHYLDMDIEDLPIPYFAVSSNLSANRVEVHDRGSLWRAVRASISLPAILPPVLRDGNLLIDGGVLNNLPVDVMRERIHGRIIAVDLSVEHEYRLAQQALPTGFEYLKGRLLPWKEPIEAPTLARVIMKTTTLASRREVEIARRSADLYMNVPLAEYDLLDWAKFHAIVDRGYQYACRTLSEHTAANPAIVHREDAFDLLAAARLTL
ncbi:MAG: patatin-like phospholipase family protein [Betaproteobacteria bacterium]|nr:patatin-like phospholipase family protein [Betaproteobacteria bacterium]